MCDRRVEKELTMCETMSALSLHNRVSACGVGYGTQHGYRMEIIIISSDPRKGSKGTSMFERLSKRLCVRRNPGYREGK